MSRRTDRRRWTVAPPTRAAGDYLGTDRRRLPGHANDNPPPPGRAGAWLAGLAVIARAVCRRIATGLRASR